MLAALRYGYKPKSAFEPKARVIYGIVAVEFTLAVILFRVLGLHVRGITIPDKLASAMALILSAWAARRIGFDRVAAWLEATSLTIVAGFCGWALLYPGTVWALPYGDWWLSAVDNVLGFDFSKVYNATKEWPLGPVYRSFTWQTPVVMLGLVLFRRDPWPLALAMCVSMIFTILIYPFATAVGPIGYYGLGPPGDWTPTIEALRDHGARIITPKMLVGMVSLPSFHAAVGALMIWATWPIRILRWPFLLLNFAMLFTTIVYGEHYLVDLIAGVAVAAVAAVAARFIYEHPALAVRHGAGELRETTKSGSARRVRQT